MEYIKLELDGIFTALSSICTFELSQDWMDANKVSGKNFFEVCQCDLITRDTGESVENILISVLKGRKQEAHFSTDMECQEAKYKYIDFEVTRVHRGEDIHLLLYGVEHFQNQHSDL